MLFNDRSTGRSVILRGVNFADAKCPFGLPTHQPKSLDTTLANQVSYVNTPFPLSDAPRHLEKLRFLGFNVLRLPVVWEALEHTGPGVYDTEYLNYVRDLVRICNQHDFKVMINPHQDLWSRFTGGSGMPLWTLHLAGLDPDSFAGTHAALRHADWPVDNSSDDKKPEELPPMLWTSNHDRLASATMFALFWAGSKLAPICIVDGINIQAYLQNHYFAAYAKLAEYLGDLVWSYDSMNEPDPGYLGWKNLNQNERDDSPKMHTCPTPIQAMRLGMGMEQTVDKYRLGKTGPHKDGTLKVKPQRACWIAEDDRRWRWIRDDAWKLGACVWGMHGVWDIHSGELKKPEYFAAEEDWVSKYWRPFWTRWAGMLREHSQQTVILAQPPVFAPPPDDLDLKSVAPVGYSPHFYDALTVMHHHWHRRWNVDVMSLLRGDQSITSKISALKLGPSRVRKGTSIQVGRLATHDMPDDVPTIIGETGVPSNLDNCKAYKDGDYSEQVTAFDTLLSSCDDHLLSYTLWAYSSVSTHKWGDGWNGEDLSIFCPETGSFPSHKHLNGFRAATAWCRPYVRSIPRDVELLSMCFDYKTSNFSCEVEVAGSASNEESYVEIYVPWLHYRRDDSDDHLVVDVQIASDCTWSLESTSQSLRWDWHGCDRSKSTKLKLRLARCGGPLNAEQLGTIVTLQANGDSLPVYSDSYIPNQLDGCSQ